MKYRIKTHEENHRDATTAQTILLHPMSRLRSRLH